jgi:hypothetical protein
LERLPDRNPKKARLPFEKWFVGGILTVFIARELSIWLESAWILWAGLVVGIAASGHAVFRALKDL